MGKLTYSEEEASEHVTFGAKIVTSFHDAVFMTFKVVRPRAKQLAGEVSGGSVDRISRYLRHCFDGKVARW